MAKYKLSAEKTHNRWDRDISAVLRINPGDVVEIQAKEGSDGNITRNSTVEDIYKADINKVHPLTGPIYISGAKPGDTLSVRILRIEPDDWGWTYFRPGLGYLKDEFSEGHLVHWKIDRRRHYVYSDSLPNIRIPLQPFCGVMGVAPSEPGKHTTIPPRDAGGNTDIKYLTAGSTLYLPVFVEGALFSVGDCHAAQGDGEVCLTAIEIPATVTLRFDLKKGYSISAPRFETPEYYGVTGYGKTLDEAMRKAVKHMIDFLVQEKSLQRKDAYILCSAAVDFRVCEVVNEPHVLISGLLPKGIFKSLGRHSPR